MVRAVRQPEPSPRPTAAEDGRPLAGVRVLVADDDRIPRRIAAAAVLRAGGEPVEAEDGVAALALWAAGGLTRPAFDAALLDFVMPGLDGADLIRTLRDLGFRGPAIGLTAAATEAEVVAWRAAGCDDVLPKGTAQAELADRLADALARLPDR